MRYPMVAGPGADVYFEHADKMFQSAKIVRFVNAVVYL